MSVPAFCRLWTAQEVIDAEPTAAVFAGSADRGRRLSLRLAEPYMVPGSPPGLPSVGRQYLAGIASA